MSTPNDPRPGDDRRADPQPPALPQVPAGDDFEFGVEFQCAWCMECQRDVGHWDDSDDGCEIAMRATAWLPGDLTGWPAELVLGDGEEKCTAFVPLGGQVPTEAELEAAGQLNLLEMAGKK